MAPGVARLIQRTGTRALTIMRWWGRDLPRAVALRDESALDLPAEAADALYWVDYLPDANWAHRCAFVLADVDGAVVHERPAQWPPKDLSAWEVVHRGDSW